MSPACGVASGVGVARGVSLAGGALALADGSDVADGVREHFSDAEAAELTLDVMRNASNKIAVSLAADSPRVAEGTERYLIDAEGQTVFAGYWRHATTGRASADPLTQAFKELMPAGG